MFHQSDGFAHRWALLEEIAQTSLIRMCQRDKWTSILKSARIENGNHPWMDNFGGERDFSSKSRPKPGVYGQISPNHLDGDITLERDVGRSIDHAGCTFTDFIDEGVAVGKGWLLVHSPSERELDVHP
jgi:hypothetical protein